MEALASVVRLYREDLRQHQLVSAESIAADRVITPFRAARVLAAPSRLTVQVSGTRHILLAPEVLTYVNHSCDPNAFFDTESLRLVSLRRIARGDEITFFYPSTEWDLAEPFACGCGRPACLGLIQGARHLPRTVLERYRLAPHIRRLLALAVPG